MVSSAFRVMDKYLHHGFRNRVTIGLAFNLGAHSSGENTLRKMIVAVLLQTTTVSDRHEG